MNKLLGIYIPTYNRKSDLKECIESFIPQVSRYGIPIYVSDNSTNDETELLIGRMRKRYPNIFYRRNRGNLGFSMNVVNLLRMGKTEYVWLFSDDDKIEDGTVGAIMRNLQSGYDFLQINSTTYNSDVTRKTGKPSIDAVSDVVYEKGEHERALMNAGVDYAGFMSQIITRRRSLLKELARLNKREVPRMDYLHTVLFFRSIIGKKGLLIARPLIKYRSTGKAVSKEIEMRAIRYPDTLDMLKGYYDERVIAKAKRQRGMLVFIFINKRDQPAMSKANMGFLMRSRHLPIHEKALGIVILSLPDSLVRLVAEPTKRLYHKVAGS